MSNTKPFSVQFNSNPDKAEIFHSEEFDTLEEAEAFFALPVPARVESPLAGASYPYLHCTTRQVYEKSLVKVISSVQTPTGVKTEIEEIKAVRNPGYTGPVKESWSDDE